MSGPADPVDVVAAWEATGTLVDAGEHRVWVRDAEAAEDRGLDPFLVLHGFPSCSFDWRHVLDRLRATRRVVLVDFLGFGLSDKPDQRYSLRGQADVVEAAVAHLGIERVTLLTHDMGDSVGGELLARDLDDDLGFGVSARVLTNGSIYIDMAQLTDGQQLLLALPDEHNDLLGADGGDAFRRGLAATFSSANPADEEELACQWKLVARQDGPALLPRTIRYIEDRRAEERRFTGGIEDHPSPLGVVWGADDPVAVHAMTGRLLEVRPDAELITLDAVGHYPMIEAPGPFADAVDRLL